MTATVRAARTHLRRLSYQTGGVGNGVHSVYSMTTDHSATSDRHKIIRYRPRCGSYGLVAIRVQHPAYAND